MKTSNPALSKNIFREFGGVGQYTETMTIQGVVNKAFILLALLLITAIYVWGQFFKTGSAESVTGWMLIGIVGGLVLALITIFNKKAAPITAPIYALLEGLAVGGISALVEARYPGLVIQAAALTFGTLFSLLFLYKARIINVSENFKLGVIAATGGIFIVYLVSFIMGLLGMNLSFIHGNGIVGIGFSLFVVTIAALNLVLDFDFIENGARSGAPLYMEWYAAFGLMVTLIWLYIEILRLLTKLQSRR
ncbi:MAG: Bax inhibitor-1/YccA family protein [Elusimicrobiota bacterium]